MPPQKRKSGQGAGAAKMQRLKSSSELGVPEALNHVQKITDWLRETVHPGGGPDQWLERTYKTEACWNMPPASSKWGRRFRTCPDLPGVEALAIVKPDKTWFEKPYKALPPLHPESVPNAFQFCRQLEVLKRAGSETESFEEWESASAVARAYKIGKFEAAAVSNLMHKIEAPVTAALKDAVQKRGMRPFILHETALLVIKRMCSDFDRMPLGARRPWNFKDTVNLHILCGGFLHFKGLLQRKLSAQEFDETVPKLDDQFLMGFLDADIDHALQSCVPPGELGKGQTYVKTWMQKNFNIVLLANSQLSNILGLFAKFTSELGVDGGTVQLGTCVSLKRFAPWVLFLSTTCGLFWQYDVRDAGLQAK
eukprot:s350_g15.t1